MSSDWLVTASFEQSLDIISAINTLAIHAKLLAANSDSPISTVKLERAREHLSAFLTQMERAVNDAAKDTSSPVLGTNPRFGEFIEKFLDQRRLQNYNQSFGKVPIGEFRQLLTSSDKTKLPTLISYLDDLRLLMEQHAHTDIDRMLGDL